MIKTFEKIRPHDFFDVKPAGYNLSIEREAKRDIDKKKENKIKAQKNKERLEKKEAGIENSAKEMEK